MMNKQRNVVYKNVTTHCLANVWPMTMITPSILFAEGLVNSFQEQSDYEGFKMAVIVRNFGIDTAITQQGENQMQQNWRTKLYLEGYYPLPAQNSRHSATKTVPVFRNIRQTQGSHIENVVVPLPMEKVWNWLGLIKHWIQMAAS